MVNKETSLSANINRYDVPLQRVRAMRQAQVIAKRLIEEYQDVLRQQYKGDRGYFEITKALPGEIINPSFPVALAAVKIAIRYLIPKEERVLYRQQHEKGRDQRLSESGFLKTIGLKGLLERNKGMTSSDFSQMARKGVEARGLTAWTDEERNWALQHLNEFAVKQGYNYTTLAQSLNELFHEGKLIRSKHVGNAIRYFMRKQVSN